MERQRQGALIAAVAVAVACAAGTFWWSQREATAAADRADLRALLQRAVRLKSGGANANELGALLEAARRQPTAELLPDYCELLTQLSYCTTVLARQHDPALPARDLVALHRAVRAAHPEQTFTAAMHRHFAEACFHASDFTGLAQAVHDGLAVAADAPPLETAMLWVNACKLHCALGRLDQAQAAVVAARRAAAATRSAAVRSAIGLVEADLCLMDERYDDAARALEDVAPDEPLRAYYAGILPIVRGPRDLAAEETLVAWSRRSAGSPALRRAAAAKAVQIALLHGDDAAGAERLPTLLALAPIAEGGDEGRSATLAIELALRGWHACDATLLDHARSAFAALLRNWRSAPSLPGGIGFLHLEDRATLVANLLRLELRLDEEHGARSGLAHVVAAHAASHPMSGAGAPDANALLASLLGERHGLLVYVPGRYCSVLVAADRTNVRAFLLAGAPAVRGTVDAWHDAVGKALAGGTTAPLATCGAAAANALLPAAVRRHIADWRRVSICGGSQLQCPPFDLLPIVAGGRERALGEELAIEHLGNLTGDAVRAPARQRGEVLFAASLLVTTGGARPGRFPPELADACVAPHAAAGTARTMLLDAEASCERVLSQLGAARVVHLVAHGISEPGREHANALLFDDDPVTGRLRGEQLRGRDLRGLVAVLSACSAGDAPWRRGGDPLAASLAGAFLASGARCVLVPTTTVRLDNQLRAMASVHRELAAGAPLAEALLAARRACTDAAARLELLLMQVHGRGF